MKTRNLLMFAAILFMAACSQDEDDFNLHGDHNAVLDWRSPEQNKLLANIRSATAKYQRIEKALQDGFIQGSPCVKSADGLGAMGYHYIDTIRIDGVLNPLEPEVLVYEKERNGRMRLVAIEYLIVAPAWDAVNTEPPMLGTVAFDDHREIIFVENEEGEMVPVNAKGGPPFPHYQLHVWVWKNNPSGMFAPYNPNVTCH
ncbi:MAG: hypothetical protein JJU28_21800 [Cyclobacteriaceae bacterium]|nr:hypothetical protein [Cyclobacteriaceae bacterium]